LLELSDKLLQCELFTNYENYFKLMHFKRGKVFQKQFQKI